MTLFKQGWANYSPRIGLGVATVLLGLKKVNAIF
jgi:hypothetical protein